MSLLNRIREYFKPKVPVGKPTQPKPTRKKHGQFAIVAAGNTGGKSVWSGTSDDFNQEYVSGLQTVIQRSQDIYVNNPDAGGWARQRTAQVIGRGVAWKHNIVGEEVGMAPDAVAQLNRDLNRRRMLHGVSGGLDYSGRGRTEAILQEVTLRTGLVQGGCLVHRMITPGALIPLALEIIPGSRIDTPPEKLGDPTVSYGIHYTDDRRTRVLGFYVRKPNRTVSSGFAWDLKYDYIPAIDAAPFFLTEIAGLDRSMPAFVNVIRTLRNKNEFAESALGSARAGAKRFGAITVEKGGTAWGRAGEDSQQELPDSSDTEQNPVGVITVGENELLYLNNGETYVQYSAKLPEPNFSEFMEYQDERCARGLNTSKSRFTRTVQSSYSAGRQEEQHDAPAEDQLFGAFAVCWNRVHEWFMDAAVMSGVVMPGYADLRPYYCNARVMRPGKEHINPVDTGSARKIGYGLRTLTPAQACEEDGKDLETNLREWGEALKLARTIEKEMGLEPGSLDYLLEDKEPPNNVNANEDLDEQKSADNPEAKPKKTMRRFPGLRTVASA